VIQLPETPLSARGLEQARRLGRRLASEDAARVVSSDLARAAMTAEAVCHATGLSLELDPLLQERSFGDLRGTAYADLAVDPYAPDYAPPGGETWPVFHARVDRAWARLQALAAEDRGALVVVTHGLVCHSILSRHVPAPSGANRLAPERPAPIPNTALTILAGPAPWRLERLACTAHLTDAGTPAGTGVQVI
jgi:broad specificity phosphatase PhoE